MIGLDDLFRAIKEIELPGGLKGQVRALSDAEIKERRRYSLLQELEVAKELEDETSDAYRLEIAPLAAIDIRGPLVSTVLAVRRIEIQAEADLLYPNIFIPIPDDADDVAEREVLKRRGETEAQTREHRAEHIKQRLQTAREKLEGLEMKTLRKMAQQLAITVAARSAFLDGIRWYTVYAGVYAHRDGQLERLCQSPDAVRDIPARVIDRLHREVEEVNTVDPWEIAKNA